MYGIRSLSAVWNHHEVMYVINPKEKCTCGDAIHAARDYIRLTAIPYQSFGLDRKKQVSRLAFFLAPPEGLEPSTP